MNSKSVINCMSLGKSDFRGLLDEKVLSVIGLSLNPENSPRWPKNVELCNNTV